MANERLRATSWRFEQIKTATNSSAIAQHRKIEVIKRKFFVNLSYFLKFLNRNMKKLQIKLLTRKSNYSFIIDIF